MPKLEQHLARRWRRQVRADSVEGTAVIHDAKHPISKPAEPGPEAWFDLAGGGAQLIAYGGHIRRSGLSLPADIAPQRPEVSPSRGGSTNRLVSQTSGFDHRPGGAKCEPGQGAACFAQRSCMLW